MGRNAGKLRAVLKCACDRQQFFALGQYPGPLTTALDFYPRAERRARTAGKSGGSLRHLDGVNEKAEARGKLLNVGRTLKFRRRQAHGELDVRYPMACKVVRFVQGGRCNASMARINSNSRRVDRF